MTTLASKYTPDQIEKMLARYEFLRDYCGEFRIEYEHRSELYEVGFTRSGFAKSVDAAIEFHNQLEEDDE